jgi:hypothetical protein
MGDRIAYEINGVVILIEGEDVEIEFMGSISKIYGVCKEEVVSVIGFKGSTYLVFKAEGVREYYYKKIIDNKDLYIGIDWVGSEKVLIDKGEMLLEGTEWKRQ